MRRGIVVMNRCLWRLHPPPLDESMVVSIGDGNACYAVSSVKYGFNLGDDVYIRPKSVKELGMSGRIVKISSDSSTTPRPPTQQSKKRKLVEDVRVSVRQHCPDKNNRMIKCGHMKNGVRPSRLFPVYDICEDEQLRSRSLVLLTPDTTNYRQLASSHVRMYDKVLEIGCSTGECTALLMRRLMLLHSYPCQVKQDKGFKEDENFSHNKIRGSIVAFDIGSDMIKKAKNRVLSELNQILPKGMADAEKKSDEVKITQLNFHKIDAITEPERALAYATVDNMCPSVVLIDIGGNRELKAVVHIVQWVQSAFSKDPPRLVIIKSQALVDDLSSSTTFFNEKEADLRMDPAGELVDDQSILEINNMRPIILKNGTIQHAHEWFSSLMQSSTNENDGAKGRTSIKTMDDARAITTCSLEKSPRR